jgi:cathepsin L
MKSFAFAAVFAAANAMSTIEFEYMQYCAQYNKVTNDVEEFNTRMGNFAFVDAFIKENNAGNETHVAGHNQFSDWSHAEYKSILGYARGEQDVRNVKIFDESMNADSLNWVDAGAVTPVKDQGQCGSCWAFSTTGSLEGAHFVASGELLSFSEQQLVDCAGIRYGNMGCNGGLQDSAYKYYEAGYDAMLESAYKYTSGGGDDSTKCLYDASQASNVTVKSYVDVTPSSPSQMMAALNTQPLAVAIEADKMVFQTYHSGVLTSSKCGTNLDHAVLAVGYGTEDGEDYWLVKNSWNTTWGDQGYIKLGRNSSDGVCGVQIDPNQPTTN